MSTTRPAITNEVDTSETLSPEELAALGGTDTTELVAPTPAGATVSMTPAELQALVAGAVNDAVAKALAGGQRVAPATGPTLGAKSKEFVKVRCNGTYVAVLANNVKTQNNYEATLNMPKDFTMGDLFRCLPLKLAREFKDFKRLRSIEPSSLKVMGPAVKGKDGVVASDYIVPKVLPKHTAAQHINKAAGVEDEDTTEGGLTGVPTVLGQVGDTTEYGDDGLPPIVAGR